VRREPAVHLEVPGRRHEAAFRDGVRRSRAVHGTLVLPPSAPAQYRDYLKRIRRASHRGYFVCASGGELAGVINVSEIVRGVFQSAYLGFYALAPYAGRGYMRAGLRLVIERAFGALGLHRVEANIQPRNRRSKRLVASLGFRREGLSPRYLEIAGRWRDHERWALTVEDWRRRRDRVPDSRRRKR
jgi:ribosomal-protein-alanine N-acetyltransferase